jgi:uncharacterized protein YcbK (DUF882 family)
MKLSKNFTLNELTRTDTGLPNVPDEKEKAFLLLLAIFLLQPIRDRHGRLKVNSGFRSLRVNRHKDIKGSPTSQHPEGQAGDIVPLDADLYEVYEWIVNESGLDFGQCIIYPDRGIIHISLPRLYKENGQALISHDGKYPIYSKELLNEIRG